MIHKIKHHTKRIAANIINRIKGFTLIELLVVIALLGILAAAVLVAINPGKRMAQSRDAIRRQDVNNIANALIGYYALIGKYPEENSCDSSIGIVQPGDCSTAAGTDWNQTASNFIRQQIVVGQAFLKALPRDPINNPTYYYKYEPGLTGSTGGYCSPTSDCYYWIGTLLETPLDSTKPVFRCTDNPLFTDGAGCKEVSAGASFNTVTN